MSLVIRKAEELADSIRRSEEYQKFMKARETVEQHESAKIMLKDFARLQENLRRKQLMGQQLTEDDKVRLQKMGEMVSYNPYVRSLLEAEMAFAELMAKVQDILGGIFEDGDGESGENGGEAPKPDPAPSPRSKLWVPGR